MTTSPPLKLTLYTSKISIFGHRVKILLHHLQVPFTEVLISLDQPREPWYLAINPRGLVPALEIEDIASGLKEAVIESALICQFLLDLAQGWGGEFAARASEISPQGYDLATTTKRYHQGLFLETNFADLRAAGRSLQQQRSEDAQDAFVSAARKLDPVCPQPGHYFGENKTISFVEVFTGPYLIRLDASIRWGLMENASGVSDRLQVEAPKFYAWMKKLAVDKEIQADTWDEELQRSYMTERLVKAGIQIRK